MLRGPARIDGLCSVATSGLVHGDLRSHVILSPSCIVAGSSHVCESIAIALNTAYEEHGDLPKVATVQLDNASPNPSMLVFGFCAMYVLFGIVDKFRVRFELAPRPEPVVRIGTHFRRSRVGGHQESHNAFRQP
jgi:hypothetical protein